MGQIRYNTFNYVPASRLYDNSNRRILNFTDTCFTAYIAHIYLPSIIPPDFSHTPHPQILLTPHIPQIFITAHIPQIFLTTHIPQILIFFSQCTLPGFFSQPTFPRFLYSSHSAHSPDSSHSPNSPDSSHTPHSPDVTDRQPDKSEHPRHGRLDGSDVGMRVQVH